MSDEQELIAEAILGRDAEDFMASDLGRIMLGNADQESEEALKELSVADPTDSRLIVTLQAKVWRARSFRAWLAELVVNGRQAMTVLDSMDRDD